jgi:hypothetical protein
MFAARIARPPSCLIFEVGKLNVAGSCRPGV